MISADQFVEAARARGFGWYAGVPCSFLTPFINYVLNDDQLSFVSSANEGDAVATATGLAIGGQPAVVMMQNSGLGNAVSPLTSLSYVFRVPVLLICTHRGAPGLQDEPQHVLMGQITGALFDLMHIPWEVFPVDPEAIRPALQRACEYMAEAQRPYAFIMQKGAVAPHALRQQAYPPAARSAHRADFFQAAGLPARHDALRRIVALTPPERTVVVATTGYTGRELYAIEDRANHLYMVGSMGCASALGLGLSLARPDLSVIVVDGDGAALMRMGNFATVGAYGGANLIHVLLDNEVHDSTGAQATVSAGVAFSDVAAACGYQVVLRGNDINVLDEVIAVRDAAGPRFAHLKIRPGTIDPLPRPALSPERVLRRFMHHIDSGF